STLGCTLRNSSATAMEMGPTVEEPSSVTVPESSVPADPPLLEGAGLFVPGWDAGGLPAPGWLPGLLLARPPQPVSMASRAAAAAVVIRVRFMAVSIPFLCWLLAEYFRSSIPMLSPGCCAGVLVWLAFG